MKGLRELRKRHGYSRYRVAKEIGVSHTAYDYIEKKCERLRFDIFMRVVAFFELSNDEAIELIEIAARGVTKARKQKK